MIISESFFFTLIVVIVVLLIWFFWRYTTHTQPAPKETKGVDITGDNDALLRKWDCSTNNRQIVFSDVPAGLTPYIVPFNEAELRKQEKEGFRVLHSIAADVRFRDNEGREKEKFDNTVTLWLSYNAEDLLSLHKNNFKVNDLVPVKIVPGQTNWKPFPTKNVNDDNLSRGEFGGVYIYIETWGDPPIGWGSPKGGI